MTINILSATTTEESSNWLQENLFGQISNRCPLQRPLNLDLFTYYIISLMFMWIKQHPNPTLYKSAKSQSM